MKLSKIVAGVLFATSMVSVNAVAGVSMSKRIMPDNVPSPANNKTTKARVELGRLLYFDARLSKSGQVSCATCHNPQKGWSDGQVKAVGVFGRVGPRNSPTVLNSAFQKHQFWDGRAKSLEDQALGPMQAGVEMDMKLEDVLKIVKANKGYVSMFKKLILKRSLLLKL